MQLIILYGLYFLGKLGEIYCQQSNSTSTIVQITTAIPKSVIAIAVLLGALLVGAIVARLADYLYDRQTAKEISDANEQHATNLLKARFALLAFKKEAGSNDAKNSDDIARKYTRIWFTKTLRKKFQRARKVKEDASLETGSSNATVVANQHHQDNQSHLPDSSTKQSLTPICDFIPKTNNTAATGSRQSSVTSIANGHLTQEEKF